MQKLSLKLLNLITMVNIVNFNTPYCMEYNNKLNEIYNCYMKAIANDDTYAQNEQITILYDNLFRNDGKNLENIFSLNKNTLSNISNVLYSNNAKKCLINLLKENKSVYNIVSNIFNNKQVDNIYVTNVIKVIKECRDIVTWLQELDMDILFKDIYCSYINKKSGKEEKQILITKFWQGLFGNNGNNLEKILLYSYDNELYHIAQMLNICDNTKKYSLNSLKHNENLRNKILTIVTNIKEYNNKSISFQNIINHMKCAILMYKFDMDIDFKTTYSNYYQAETEQKHAIFDSICKNLFCNNFDNLQTILSGNYNIECKYINKIFEESDEMEIQSVRNLLQELDIDTFNKLCKIIDISKKSTYNHYIITKIKEYITAIDKSKLRKNITMNQTNTQFKHINKSKLRKNITMNQTNTQSKRITKSKLRKNTTMNQRSTKPKHNNYSSINSYTECDYINSSFDDSFDTPDNDSINSNYENICNNLNIRDVYNNNTDKGNQFTQYNTKFEQLYGEPKELNHNYNYKYLDDVVQEYNTPNMYNNLELYLNKNISQKIKYLNIKDLNYLKYQNTEIFKNTFRHYI